MNDMAVHLDPNPALCSPAAAYLELDLLQGRAAGLGQQAAAQSDGALLGACTCTQGRGGGSRQRQERHASAAVRALVGDIHPV